MVSNQAGRLVADAPAIAAAHFAAEADPYSAANPAGYVNVGTAENRLVWDLLEPRLASSRARTAQVSRYAPLYGTADLRAAVAAFLARTRRTEVDAEDVLIVGGATAALDIIASTLCDPGEAIAVPAPYYGAFDTDLAGRSGAVLLPVYPGVGDGLVPGPAAITAAVRRARATGLTVRALAVASPHNPLGYVYGGAELAELAEVCARLDLDLIADEIYAGAVFAGPEFVSAMELPGDRIHTIWGFAKDFGLPGFKVGVLHTRHPGVRAAARELAYFAPVSTDTQQVLVELLDSQAWVDGFLSASRDRLRASYAATADLLGRADIPFLPADAGFSVWIDLRAWLDDDFFASERALWRRLFEAGRVSMLPGEVFHSPRPGWFRLCHTVAPEVVREAVARISAVLTEAGSALVARG